MPVNARWIAAAQQIPQVNTLTIGGTPSNGQVYKVLIPDTSGVFVAYTASGSDTNISITAALLALLQASSLPQFQEITWEEGSTTTEITGTGPDNGTPFTQTSSATGTGTLVTATATASGSPNDWSNPNNWNTLAVPINGDSVSIDNTDSPIKYGLNQSAVTLVNISAPNSFLASCGLPEVNTNGYVEYRNTFLKIKATGTASFGDLSGSGFTQFKIDFLDSAPAVIVNNTGTSTDQILGALIIKGTALASLKVLGGTVSVCPYDADVGGIAGNINIGSGISGALPPVLTIGSGVVIGGTTIVQGGGTLTLASDITDYTGSGGQLITQGTVNANSVTVNAASGGSVNVTWLASGTITSLNPGNGGVVDFTANRGGVIVTNCIVDVGSTLLDPSQLVTWSNGVQFAGNCRVGDVVIDIGPGSAVFP